MRTLKTVYVTLSMLANLALVAATVYAWAEFGTQAGILVSAFTLTSLSIANATMSLHFKDEE